MPRVNTPLGEVEAVPFPRRIVKVGDSDRETVKKIQHRLIPSDAGQLPNTVSSIKKGPKRR